MSLYKSKEQDPQLFEFINIQRDSKREFHKTKYDDSYHINCPEKKCPPFKFKNNAIFYNEKVNPNLRTVQSYPNPLNLIDNYIFEMKSIQNLQDLNCQSLGKYL